ncbi:MAG: hypothetical protein ABW157_19645 [Candidatus Thiodiazotropha sp. LLP2]
MRKTGILNNYHWVEDREAWLKDLLSEITQEILGTRAINTSFDSGILGGDNLRLSQEELNKGWYIVNNRAVSPILEENWIDSFPFTDGYDEWYFFEEMPQIFDAVAFCNYYGVSLEKVGKLSIEGGCDLIFALQKYKPVAIAGWNNEFSYYIKQK